ncbi:MAG: hypothetical protein ABIG89_06450 [Candidatus Woesearchaeota archaeon]
MKKREAARKIESMELDIGDKANILLVKFGLKPNCFLEVRSANLNYFNRARELFLLPDVFLEGIVEQLQSLEVNLIVGAKEKYNLHKRSLAYPQFKRPSIELAKVCVGDNAAELSELLSHKFTLEVQPTPEYHMRLGELLGYPYSARYAFAYDKTRLAKHKGFSDEIRRRPYDRGLDVFKFFQFLPTKHYFATEIDLAKKIHDIIRQYLPDIYEKIVRFQERMSEEKATEEMVKFLYTSPI